MDRFELAPGAVLQDRYEIVEFVGEGGMGALYKAKHKSVGREVAVKLLRRSLSSDPKAYQRFQLEAKICGGLHHTNVISVYDYGETPDGMPFLVMDFLHGSTLSEVIERFSRIPPARTIDITKQVCDGLSYAHKRALVHRDLKPSNVMLVDEGGRELVKLMDFGIAKKVDVDPSTAQNLTHTGEVFGSPLYMSPEQCQGLQLDARSDIYSLGCMIYEMLTGVVPLRGDNPMQTLCKHLAEVPKPISEVAPDIGVPPYLEQIVMKCMRKDPAQRFQSVDEVRAALDNPGAMAGSDVQDRTVPSVQLSPVAAAATAAAGQSGSTPSSLSAGSNTKWIFLGVGLLALTAATVPMLLQNSNAPAPPDTTIAASTSGTTGESGTPSAQVDSKSLTSNDDESAQTKIDPVATAGGAEKLADKMPAALDRTAAALDKTSASLDKSSVAQDKTTSALDKNSVALDKTSAALDKTAAVLDKTAAALSKPPVVEKVPATQSKPPESKPAEPSPPQLTPKQNQKRLEANIKEELKKISAEVDKLNGEPIIWSVDWDSMDPESIQYVQNVAIERVRDVIRELCSNDADRAIVRGKIKKIVIRNVPPSAKGVTFKDGVLTLLGAFGNDYPSEYEVRKEIENGVL